MAGNRPYPIKVYESKLIEEIKYLHRWVNALKCYIGTKDYLELPEDKRLAIHKELDSVKRCILDKSVILGY